MNISHNRFVLFTAPCLCLIAAMITTRTIEQGIYTVWFMASVSVDTAHIYHRRLFNKDPRWFDTLRSKVLSQNIMTAFVAACGFPRLCLVSTIIVYAFQKPLIISYVVGICWSIWFCASHFVDLRFPLDCHTRWYGILIIVWSIMYLAMEKEIQHLNKHSTVHKYRIVWAFRFIEQIFINIIRWFVWCDCVFPYKPRWDMFYFTYALTFSLMYVTNLRRPEANLVFNRPMKHIPAPCADTALNCNVCRDCQKVVDVEHGFTL